MKTTQESKCTVTLRTAAVGSVSHGTLRTVDLLDALGRELEWQVGRNGDFLSRPENFPMRDRLNAVVGECWDLFDESGENLVCEKEESGECEEFLNETLFDALGEFAPPYCYFGAHCGDGSDFGFWPSVEAIEELPCGAENADGGDYKEVNDHGNVTVFSADGQVIAAFV